MEGLGGQVLTGESIRAANNERLGGLFIHEDFFEHDSLGNPTVPRWTPLVQAECLNYGGWHGAMTAGIMLGNGWQSDKNGGSPLAFRGVAPKATYECYSKPGAKAHVSSHSYVSTSSTTATHWDAAVVGDSTTEKFHAHVAAGGNSGITLGYFAMKNNAKNAMIVANAQVNGRIHPSNSSGPTYDGRIKPDITAPTRNYISADPPGFAIEIEEIALWRGPFKVYTWTFDMNSPLWHQGWGETDNPAFGQLHLSTSQTLTGNMRLDINPGPYGTQWHNAPLVGTQIFPYTHPAGGYPLSFFGYENDVLKVRYRAIVNSPASSLGYFNMKPTWMRSFPPVTSSDWYSQGTHGAIGIGDGQWRTLETPVGLATDIVLAGNPHWPGLETWEGFNIEYLALRFGGVDFQPTTVHSQYYQRSGGTSGASPVVGGAYALAMEHHSDLHRNVDLDDKIRKSALFAGATEPYGIPFSSTWKAIYVHTAEDMTDTIVGPVFPATPPNPDTGVPTSYHAGPDYTTGYGMLNVQSGIDLMTLTAKGQPLYELLESAIGPGQYHSYTFKVDDSFAAGKQGLKVTLVWDDEPAYGSTSQIEPKLVNNLGLVLEDPYGNVYYPWSLDLPYEYDETNGPHVVEPEPITDADIVPARRDQPNDRDNIEQVLVDDVSDKQSGKWVVHVVDNGMGAPSIELQNYSLVFSPWSVPGQCHDCG